MGRSRFRVELDSIGICPSHKDLEKCDDPGGLSPSIARVRIWPEILHPRPISAWTDYIYGRGAGESAGGWGCSRRRAAGNPGAR